MGAQRPETQAESAVDGPGAADTGSHNPLVLGSIPTRPTMRITLFYSASLRQLLR